MKTQNLLLIALVPVLFSCRSNAGKPVTDSTTVTSSHSTATAFPADFKLLATEIPKGFIHEAIGDEAKSYGIFANPSIVKSKEFLSGLYPNPDLTKIDSVYFELFVKDKVSKEVASMSEMGVYTTAYKSKEDLEKEIKKITPEQSGHIYLRKDNFLLNVWSDSDSYATQVRELADKLKKRLTLTEFKPARAEVATDMTAVDSTVVESVKH